MGLLSRCASHTLPSSASKSAPLAVNTIARVVSVTAVRDVASIDASA